MNPLVTGKYSNVFSQAPLLPGSPGTSFDFEALISKAPKDQQDRLRTRLIESQMEAAASQQAIAPFIQQPYTLDEIGRFREQEARRSQELGKESLREAFKYTTLANIPKTIAQGFGNIAAMNVLGARNATEVMAQTLASYPRAQFSSIPYQPQKYFE